MSAQTITAVVNYDSSSISPLLNGETITINGGKLVINSDMRWAQQSAVVGNMTISSSLGGEILIDGTTVWWLPFDASTGTVPSLGSVGVNDSSGNLGGSGEFLGVFTALGVSPSTAGTALPSSGFVKFRSTSVAFQDNEVVTFSNGATITANGIGQRGWIHVVGTEVLTVNVPRLGKFTTTGDWFYLDSTNGNDDQTIQYPVRDCCPAIQIETAPNSGVYEWWLNAGSRWGTAIQFVATDTRGKYFGQDTSTGLITLARRSSNSCGYKPTSGCKVRIPNIICSSSNSTNWTANVCNSTLASRYDFTTSLGGEVSIDKMCGNWYFYFSQAYKVQVTNSCTTGQFTSQNISISTDYDNCAVGIYADKDFEPFYINISPNGGSIKNSRGARYQVTANVQSSLRVVDCTNFFIENCRIGFFPGLSSQDREGNNTQAIYMLRCNSSHVSDCTVIGGKIILSTCNNAYVSNTKYADRIAGTTTATNGVSAIELTQCNNVEVYGFSIVDNIADVHPYGGFFTANTCENIYIHDVASYSSPINCGSNSTYALGNIINLSPLCKNITARRLYFGATRTVPVNTANTDQDILIENVYAIGSTATNLVVGINTTFRSVRCLPNIYPQTGVYGTHFISQFISDTQGKIFITGYEPTNATSGQMSILSGSPKYDGNGQLSMPNVGDSVEYTWPYKIRGFTGFDIAAPVFQGTNWESFRADYSLNGSAYKMLMRSKGWGSGTSGLYTITLTGGSTDVEVGWYVFGTNVGTGAKVVSKPSSTQIQVDVANAGTVSGQISFSLAPTEASVDPEGFDLKIKVTTITANSTNLMRFCGVTGKTTATDQQILYPIPTPSRLGTIQNIIAGSRIQIFNSTTNTELINTISASTTYSYSYGEGEGITTGDVIRIRLTHQNGTVAYLPYESVTVANSAGFSTYAIQEIDIVYEHIGLDGSLITEFVEDYPNVQIDISDVDGETTMQRLYAWWAYVQHSENGIRNWFAGIIPDDDNNYKIYTDVIDLKLDNVRTNGVYFTTEVRLYRDDGRAPVVAATTGGGSIVLFAGKVYMREGTGLSELQDARLKSIYDLVDVAVSTRLATSGYLSPDNVSILAIKAKTDNLPNDPASNTQVNTRLATSSYTTPPTTTEIKNSILDEPISSHVVSGTVGGTIKKTNDEVNKKLNTATFIAMK